MMSCQIFLSISLYLVCILYMRCVRSVVLCVGMQCLREISVAVTRTPQFRMTSRGNYHRGFIIHGTSRAREGLILLLHRSRAEGYTYEEKREIFCVLLFISSFKKT